MGLNSAVARLKRLLGASGRIVAYLLERCGSEAAQLCAQRRRFGFCLLVWFFVSKVSEASQGGVEGILESYGPATFDAAFTTLLWLSRRACFLDLLAARIDVYEENERRSTPHAVLVGRTGCAGRKRARTQLTKELYWSGCSHTQKCDHMIQAPSARPALRRASAAEFAVPPRRASAPEFGQIVNRTPPEDQAVHHIHRQVAKLELESQKTYARSPSLESQIAAPLAAPPPPVSPPGSPRSITRKFYVFPETQAPDVVPWPERCRSAPSVSIDEVLTTNLTHL